MLGPFLDVEMFKKCRPCGTEHISKWQNTSGPAHFWQLRCWKSARCCGAKHMSKSKLEKHHHDMLGPLFRRSRHDKNNYNYITHYITLQLQLQLQQQLHYTYCTTTPTTLHYTTPHYIQYLVEVTTAATRIVEKGKLQPPFGPSVDSVCHPCITTYRNKSPLLYWVDLR